MAKAIPSIPDAWQEFLLSVLFHLLFPLLPLAVEYVASGVITEKTLTLTASIYSVAIASSSRSKLVFGLGIVISIIFAIAFGLAAGRPVGAEGTNFNKTEISAACLILFMLIAHLGERYNRHVVELIPYWEFAPFQRESA